MSNFRMDRINKQLQREIALILGKRVKNKQVQDVIITGVDCARDLERAKVFFTALDVSRRKTLLRDLIEIKGVIRSMLGGTMRLRRVPSLEFRIDESADYGSRIDSILDGLSLMPPNVIADYDAAAGGDDDDWDDAEDDSDE